MGYAIVQENMIEEDGKYYPMMKAVYRNAKPYSELEYRYGPILLGQCHPVLKQYLERELRIRNEILDKLKNAPNAEKRTGEIEEEKQAVIAALKEYEGI